MINAYLRSFFLGGCDPHDVVISGGLETQDTVSALDLGVFGGERKCL